MTLTRGGAWMQHRHIRGDAICDGNLWQRTEPARLGFEFSPASIDLLMWLTQSDATQKMPIWIPPTSRTLTPGDQFLLYLTVTALRETTLISDWYETNVIRGNALIALAMPEQFAEAKVMPQPDIDQWIDLDDGWVLEAIQDELARVWTDVEKNKCRITRPDSMQRLGRVQEQILDQLFDSAERNSRRDLCRFVLEVMKRIADAHAQRGQWIGSLDTTDLRLADRTATYQCASVLLRFGARLRQWQSASQSVGYFDEGYAESQLWKSLWESCDAEDSLLHADRVLQELSF